MKENQIRELVNELRDIAIEYHGTQQLRERIARTVRAAIIQAGSSPVIPDERIAFNEWNNGEDCLLAGRDAKSAAWLAWIHRAKLGVTPAPVQVDIEMLASALKNAPLAPSDNQGRPRALVVPEECPAKIRELMVSHSDDLFNDGDAQEIWNACRTAMLQGSQPVSNRDELQVIGWLRSDYNSDDKRDHNAPLFMLGSNDPSEAWGVKYIPLSGNSPVIPGVYLADINTDHQH